MDEFQFGLFGGASPADVMQQQEIKNRQLMAAKLRQFDPEGSDYDYYSALNFGMGPTGDGTAENAGHWGSVVPASQEQRQAFGLPDDSYMVLKGASHETYPKSVWSEQARGSKIMKLGDRYFSVPQSYNPWQQK